MPEAVTVLAVEDGDQLVGCWSVINFAHVEGLWVAPSRRRRVGVLRQLWTLLERVCAARGLGAVFTSSESDVVTRLLTARGAQALPPLYVLPVQPLRRR